jgi:hypothetical protein
MTSEIAVSERAERASTPSQPFAKPESGMAAWWRPYLVLRHYRPDLRTEFSRPGAGSAYGAREDAPHKHM